ncbi:Swi3-domain-containing protein [Trametopsis cervina]|nr:Swi3-domain-containing protein [Trametopsis cervina]
MSMSIDDIWSAPVENTPPRSRKEVLAGESIGNIPGRPSPAKRRRTTLFLSSDSENDEPSSSKVPYRTRTPPADKDKDQKALVDALFDDLDVDEDDGFKELAPSLDIEQLRKQAQRNHKAKIPALTPHQILPSSSPPPEEGIGESRTTKGGRDKGDDEGTKKRKPIPKLDEARLLGESGFPQLMKMTKDFKPRGKGHEVSDLNRVLGIYQFWTHKMYPKGTFRDNVQRIERLCHSKRMHNTLSIWRDESKGLINGRRPEDLVPLGDPSDGSNSDSDSDRDVEPVAAATSAARSNSPPTRPPSSASERPSSAPPDDDEFDIDAMIQEDEERQAAESASYASLPQPPSTQGLSEPDEDQDMWDQLDAAFDDVQAPAQPPQAMDADDDDMWDIVREMEDNASSAPPPPPSASVTVLEPVPVSAPVEAPSLHHQPATNDEGWDEMYL